MNNEIKEYLEKFSTETADLFCTLRNLIFESAPSDIQETMWAKLPSYYAGDSFVRLIPFKDHINVEAKAVSEYKDALTGYKITPKGMLQIFLKQDIPFDTLKQIFADTLK